MRSLPAVGLLLGLVGVPSCAWNDEFTVCRVDAGLYRGPRPRSPCDFEQLRAAGVKTIVDLRVVLPQVTDCEERLAAEHGLAYCNCPITPVCANPEEIEAAYRQLLCKEAQPVYLHCHWSRDRTSLLVGLYRVRCQGWLPQAAYEEMLRCGLHDVFVHFHRYFWDNACGPSLRPTVAASAP